MHAIGAQITSVDWPVLHEEGQAWPMGIHSHKYVRSGASLEDKGNVLMLRN